MGELRYRTAVESFSEWVLTADRPDLPLTNTAVAMTTAAPGESVAVDVTVTNDGNAAGNRTVELIADGQVVATETVSLDGGETRDVSLSTTFDDPGEYDLAVDDTTVGSVTIQSETATPSDPGTPTDGTDEPTDGTDEPTETNEPDTETEPSDGDGSGFPWWTVVVGIVLTAIIAAAALWYRNDKTTE